jgi:hypothetical protein
MTREQRRLVETMRSTVADYGDAARARDELSGGMQWLTVKGREYLTRYRRDPVTGEQKSVSLGRRSAETESMYDRFVKGRAGLDARMDELKPVMGEQSRMAKALRLSRAPSEIGDVVRAIGLSEMIDHVTLVGEAAVFAYECEMAALLPRELLPEGGLDLLVAGVHPADSIDELAAVLRRARVGAKPSRASDAAAELRTEEGLKIRLFTTSSLDRMIDEYDNYGGREAARWALEQTPIRSIIVDRQGRGAPVAILDPRAWCIMRCMVLDMEEMSVIRHEASSELVAAMIPMVQERWPQPFEEEQVRSCGRLYEALEGEEFFPPPRM